MAPFEAFILTGEKQKILTKKQSIRPPIYIPKKSGPIKLHNITRTGSMYNNVIQIWKLFHGKNQLENEITIIFHDIVGYSATGLGNHFTVRTSWKRKP